MDGGRKQHNSHFMNHTFITHTSVSRKAVIHGAQNVEIKGKTIIEDGAYIRGDFQTVRIGRYCRIGQNTIIRPPSSRASLNPTEDQIQFSPSIIGSHTRIGKDCVIESSWIGSSVYIGDGCIISKRVTIKDCCYIEAGTIIAPDTVIPPFSRVRGCPGKIVEEGLMPESIATIFVEECMDSFSKFVKAIEN